MPCELRSQPYRYCTVSSSLFTTYIHIYKKIAQVENWVLQSHCPSTWQQGMKRRRHWIARGQFKTRPQEKYTYVEATQILVLKTKIDMKHHREIYKDSSFLKVALHARSNKRLHRDDYCQFQKGCISLKFNYTAQSNETFFEHFVVYRDSA